MLTKCMENVRTTTPLIHAITNYVTVNDCANALLACGASPIMADDQAEVEEITALCAATVINIGTLNQRTISAMQLAAAKANQLNHCLVLDPVGVGASRLRTQTAQQLLANNHFTAIRGNVSEIKSLALGTGSTQGVDANIADAITETNLPEAINFIRAFSKRTGAIIIVSGAWDIVSDAENSYIIKNGNPLMSKITGSGCMSTCIIAAYLAANPQNMLQATITAVSLMGLAGEKAAAISSGTGSLRNNILDGLSSIDTEQLKVGAQIDKF